MIDIIAIAILAMICGAEHFNEMEDWGEANEDWLRSFLDLPNGIPPHDTFGDVFARLESNEFKKCFISWVESIRGATDGEVIAIDGKKNSMKLAANERIRDFAAKLPISRNLQYRSDRVREGKGRDDNLRWKDGLRGQKIVSVIGILAPFSIGVAWVSSGGA